MPSFAFAGGGLDRSEVFRSDDQAIKCLLARSDAGVLVFWRGKILVNSNAGLCRVPHEHLCVKDSNDMTFVGISEGAPVFAATIRDWDCALGSVAAHDSIADRSEQIHPNAPAGSKFVNLRAVMNSLTAEDCEVAATAKALLDWHRSYQFCPACGHRLKQSQAGWQLHCTQCGQIHFCRISPVVIMLVLHRNSVLLGRSHGWPEGMHSLLAGFIEPGETVEAAVQRETFEETGVTVGRVEYVASQPWPFPNSLMFGFAAHADDSEILLDESELESALWVSRERLALVFDHRDESIRPPRRGAIAEYLMRLWLTGRIG